MTASHGIASARIISVMSHRFSFWVDAFGCVLQLSSSSEQARGVLDRYIFPGLPRSSSWPQKPDADIAIEEDGAEFHLLRASAVVASATRPEELVPELIHHVDEAVVAAMRGRYAVHAGVVQVGEAAILLPGMTHAGKSSLVAALLERGATYFSDEYAVLDGEGLVHPYPRPLLVRNGTPEQVPKLAETYGAYTSMAPARVGSIMALAFHPEEGWRIRPVPQSAGVMILLQNTPHVLAESPALLGVLQKAAAGARCWQGYRGDAADAAGEILRLVE